MNEMIEKICNREDLSQDQTRALFDQMLRGELDPVLISALLIGLRTKGETISEIAGAARAMRAAAAPFPRPDDPCADSCGTGGDGAHTINVSTAVAIVAAEMGIPVTKHGNRSVSSKCGSADLLEQLGVKIDAPSETARRCLDEVGICFLFAPQYHGSMRHAMPVRKALGIRTVFNLLGPLVNPAAPEYQVMGVYGPELCTPVARVLGMLGCRGALVVHGSGLDEIAVHGPTTAALLKDGDVTALTLSPEQAGLANFPLEQIRGGHAKENAAAIKRLLGGSPEPAHRAVVALNAGALAWIFGRAGDLKEGTEMALEAIDSGQCILRLKRFGEISHGA